MLLKRVYIVLWVRLFGLSLDWHLLCMPRNLLDKERKYKTPIHLFSALAELRISEEVEMTLGLINANPVVHAKKERVARTDDPHADDAVDPLEIYDILFLSSTFCFPLLLQLCPSSLVHSYVLFGSSNFDLGRI